MTVKTLPRLVKMIYEGNAIIYVATRLFNYIDKIQAEKIEQAINKAINRLLGNFNLEYKQKITFIPFRDTKEHKIVGPNRTKLIYNGDIERLKSKKLIVLLAIYDGISKDEGISFEIGLAYSRNVPIFILNTDFIWYALRSNQNMEFIVDPIIRNMAYRLVHHYAIPNRGNFLESLNDGLNSAIEKFVNELYIYVLKGPIISNVVGKYNSKTKKNNIKGKKRVFIDFCGGKCEYHREYMNMLKEQLKDDYSVFTTFRYDPQVGDNINLTQRAQIEIQNLVMSDITVFSADEPEMDSGSAALLGLAKGLNKGIILYNSSNIEIHGENNHRMIKNLMIDHSIDYNCREIRILPKLIIKCLEGL